MKVIKEKKFIKTCFMIDTFMLFIFSNWGKNDNLSPLLCAVSNSSIDEGCWAHGCNSLFCAAAAVNTGIAE